MADETVSPSRPSGPSLEERVAEFAYRCGRVLAVPAASNKELLRRSKMMGITTDEEGVTQFVHMLPLELELDALAARARPIFLEDRCHYRTGLKALRRLIRSSDPDRADEYCDAVIDLADGWATASEQAHTYFLAMSKVDGSEPTRSWSSKQVAEAWLYGDLVHADEGRQNTATRKERLIAGWAYHADVIRLARTSVAFVRGFDDELGLGLPSWTYETGDLPSGMVTSGRLVGMWSAPAAGGRWDSEHVQHAVSTALNEGKPPGDDYAVFKPPPPGKTIWVEAFPSEPDPKPDAPC
ncbi:hypothetical protein [Pseudactinotalea sp. Z1732]|uniref:hypothetical protein n=1 Tax=Micrococcales TaxID=85006 RepID=UPI003C7EC7AF